MVQNVSDKGSSNVQRELKPTFIFPSDQSGMAPAQHLGKSQQLGKCQWSLISNSGELVGLYLHPDSLIGITSYPAICILHTALLHHKNHLLVE